MSAERVQAHDDFEVRIEKANRRVEAEPERAQVYVERAQLFLNHADWKEALSDLDRALALNDNNAEIDFLRGQVFVRSERYPEAEAALNRFLKRTPNHPAGLAARAKARRGLGKHLEAARDLDRAIEEHPTPVLGNYLDRAQAFADAGPEYLGEALRGLDEALQRIGPVVNLQRLAVRLELERGTVDSALTRLQAAAAASARRESWLLWQGEILEGVGRREEALDSFRLALSELNELPSSRRETRAARQLADTLQAAIERLGAGAPDSR